MRERERREREREGEMRQHNSVQKPLISYNNNSYHYHGYLRIILRYQPPLISTMIVTFLLKTLQAESKREYLKSRGKKRSEDYLLPAFFLFFHLLVH